MGYVDWLLVMLGAVIACAGGWMQAHPERLCAAMAPGNWRQAGQPMRQVSLLGGSILFMGLFFALQMSADLGRLPWWYGTLGGLVAALVAVSANRRRGHHAPAEAS